MKTIISLLLSLVLLGGCTGTHLDIFPELENPDQMQKKIAPKLLHQDIDALVEGVKLRHPDFAGYADEVTLYQQVAELKANISTPMTRVEFFRHIGQLSHLFQDGHSFLIWPYQELDKLREQGEKPFPFLVKLSTNGVFVAKQYRYAEQVLPAGSQLISINELAVADIFTNLQRYVGGETTVLRQAFVAERLPFLLWAVYGFIDQFDIEYNHLGKTQRLRINNQQNWQIVQTHDPDTTADVVYRRLNDSTGYLDVNSFDVEPDVFSDQLKSAFSQIAQDNVSALVIDIRHNTGGNTDTATELASYIANKPFRLVSQVTEKLNTDNRGLFGYKGDIGEIIRTEWDDYVMPNASEIHFKGKVVVLVGPVSYSAAIVFATTIQDNQFGLLAGKATGGFANQSAQGNLFNLPHSQLRAYVATRLLVRPSGDNTVSVVLPELPIADKLQDQQNAIDTTLQQVLQHLSTADNHAKLQ
ncbi:S41 family peptidase [Planctobacterium marinum]|uniref:S41 family peptidase n=1 Tax=Planctobacterium marinum TaxID=1631968 RepID=UPI001E38A03A|nr:S41 family peptidase [Planctobacterium marinum]MCC2604889.1 peptidase S41 [Planctobacterium marinum]